MPVELLTIDRIPTIWGETDPVQRFVSRELESPLDVRMLRIDQRIRVGIPLRPDRRTLPVFAECRNDEEFPKLMKAAAPSYRRRWAIGVLSIDRDMLRSAQFWFPEGSDRHMADYVRMVYDRISAAVVIPPHHQIMVNRRLQFGFVPEQGVLERYYPAD